MPQRLDQALVARGLCPTRSQARDLIQRGKVLVAGRPILKPAHNVGENEPLALDPGHVVHVSRGAEKLLAALAAFPLDPAGRIALDLGASTGGFTEVLLQRQVARVYAVDVGRGQLHPSLAADPRVVVLEATDARSLDATVIPEPIGAIVVDVSFISLLKALPAALALAAPGCWLLALVKPQFEAGRDAIGKGGIVRDDAVRRRTLDTVGDWLAGQTGWQRLGAIDSPISGGDGNREFLLAAVKS